MQALQSVQRAVLQEVVHIGRGKQCACQHAM